MTDFLEEAWAQKEYILSLRERLHACPEAGNAEFETADILRGEMRKMGLLCRNYGSTAFSADLCGAKNGKTVALRADMDALPVSERTALPFSSRNAGMAHACGHDIHMAAAVGAARLLSMHRNELRGGVRFLFQPDEEGEGGARPMVEAGCLLPDVTEVYGGHVTPDLPAGKVGIRYGAFYAASNPFSVTVHGKACHAAEPQRGIDALECAAEMICAMHRLPASALSEPFVLRVCTLRAGRAENVIADRAAFCGIARTFGERAREELKQLLDKTVRDIAHLHRAEADISVSQGYPGVVNSRVCTETAERAARRLLGGSAVCRLAQPVMMTEDFGYLISACSGCFIHLGVGGAEPLHSPAFAPNGETAVLGAALYAQILYDALKTAHKQHASRK